MMTAKPLQNLRILQWLAELHFLFGCSPEPGNNSGAVAYPTGSGPCDTRPRRAVGHPGQSGEVHVFPVQDNNLTAELPLPRSILQPTLRQKYRSAGEQNTQRD